MGEPKTVLIVEDEKNIVDILKFNLQRAGYQTLEAYDGEDGLAQAVSANPDLILLDIMLPVMDGMSVLSRLHEQDGPHPAVMVFSAFASPQIGAECAALGVDLFLRKPMEPQAVCERLRLWRTGQLRAVKAEESMALELRVTEVIHQVGVPAHIKGYQYVREAIILAVQDMDVINAVTKVLYPEVARRYNTTPSRVERAVRHAIETAWDRGDLETLQRYFGYTVSNAKVKYA